MDAVCFIPRGSAKPVDDCNKTQTFRGSQTYRMTLPKAPNCGFQIHFCAAARARPASLRASTME